MYKLFHSLFDTIVDGLLVRPMSFMYGVETASFETMFNSETGEETAALWTATTGEIVQKSNYGFVTNEFVRIGSEEKSIVCESDAYGRLAAVNNSLYTYTEDGLLASVSNEDAVVSYSYSSGRKVVGYEILLVNGNRFTTSLTRDAYRQSLVYSISNCFNSVMIGNPLIYEYDDLSRPVQRNGDTFAYNARGEVIAANIGSNNANYVYDGMGNYIQVSRNQEETTYSSNELNQYMEILSATNNTRQFVYDANGNLVSNGVFTLTYDCESRLATVSSNGVLLLTNRYDAKSRRIQKITPDATHTFFYDDWNLIEERILHANGASTVVEYVWGQDLSGTRQGAGGVGGLLYLKRNGEIFIPTYDNNGNILSYVDANGTIVASYTYDAFGNTLAQTGDLATTFNHRFSTKYYDNESRLYYYGYRFYAPSLGRWLNRDPLEEDGGVNLYGFVRNASPYSFDYLGEEVRVVFHLPGDGFLSEWEIAGYAAMTVFYGSKPYKETIGPDSSGKIKFRVILKPPIATINVYFRRGLSGWQSFRARAAEMQHVESYIKYDKAVEAFKRAAERIYDCPNAANEKYARLYSELEKTASATIKYNKEYLDGKGGIHGH